MRKKIVTGVLSTAMVLSLVLPVQAAEAPQTETGSTQVEYSLGTSYTLSIPSSITLTENAGVTLTGIGVSAINTTPGEKVQIKIAEGISLGSQVSLTRDGDTGTTVVSTVTDKDDKTINPESFVVAEFTGYGATAAATASAPLIAGTGVLKFSAVADPSENAIKAGTYTGTITFTASVVPYSAE